ncbi:putative disease resistance protein RGA4 [Phragmites australis]|uniref:putative disease resistance protein RGA4 n=1 Tax=Phragmites australis TaxID=29695 RepID=UPI002D767B80|nr:putative disease resistance protein RGA4 [Phragmites australis]
MAELVVGPLIAMVREKASSYLLDQYKVMEGMEEQREILKRRLPAILDVISDAEEKGAYRAGVSAWLEALKKVSYEASDVFDEFKYEALRRDAKKKGHYSMLGMDVVSLFPTYNPIIFRYRMGKKLRRIVHIIDVLVAEMNAFAFTPHQLEAPPSKQWRQTDSIMVDSERDIISKSRDEERKKISKILRDPGNNEDLMVLPIVGVGGIGKTTFVQLIYNDPEIEKHFELRKWCCVSDNFDVGNIANNICNTKANDRDKALQDLQKEVSGKRYLIVLDDIWNRDADKWGKLKTCLKQGGKGSAVLATTRDAEVARIMTAGVVEAYNLQKLGKKYLKEMIESRAFSLQKPNCDQLDDIVDKIVDRCDGSPLAAKAVGSTLSTKTSIQEWNDILTKSNICNEKNGILPILKLSYDDLPSHMKLCFAFCAVFPKDYEIYVDTLIQLWMAHDFIPTQAEDRPETVGRETFMELTWRSFFQDVKPTSPIEYGIRKQLRRRTTCKIHDLMHDIALSVMGKECVTLNNPSNQEKLLSSDARHLFSSSDHTPVLDHFLKKQSSTLRTLLYPDKYTRGSAPHLSKYNSLRVLQFFELRELPLEPRHLQHLRYLSFANNWKIRELPEQISTLYNLQTLDLSHCKHLGQLPKGMKYMTSLRHLYTNGCASLKSMPPDLRQLTSLQTLTYFVVGASSGCSNVGELQKLNLCGELALHGLENVTEAHAIAAGLRNKEKLTHLSLQWSGEGREESVQTCHKNVLDALKPHSGLEMLRIVNYKGFSLPAWITDPSLLQHLTELHLVGCTMCEEFPQFCHLNALQVLYLENLDKLQSLCSDMSSMTFPALIELELRDLNSLERWVATEGTGGEELRCPLLEKVCIHNCPKLATLPDAAKLKVVEVNEEKPKLSLAIVRSSYMSLLSKLTLAVRSRETTPQLDFENDESSVSELRLDGCNFFFPSSPSPPSTGVWKWFGKLIDLTIHNCDVLIYWPEEVFRNLVSLKQLQIYSCNKLIGPTQLTAEPTQTTDQVLPHLNSIFIFGCESLVELFILPPSLTSIDISCCPNLESIWRKEEQFGPCTTTTHPPSNDEASTSHVPEQSSSPPNHPPPCLESLHILGCHKLVALPNLPPSLKWLFIDDCLELCSMSGQLDALVALYIYGCNKLQSLDSLGGLRSLERLSLFRCKRLTSLPGGLESCSGLRELTIIYCPAIDMKPLYKYHQERLNNLERRDLSHAHSSHPREGPKLRDPKTWKYAIPWCKDRAIWSDENS